MALKRDTQFEPTLSRAEAKQVVQYLRTHVDRRNLSMYDSDEILHFHEQRPEVQNLSDVVLVNTLAFAGDWLSMDYSELCAFSDLTNVVLSVFQDAIDVPERELFQQYDGSGTVQELKIPVVDTASQVVRESEAIPEQSVDVEHHSIMRRLLRVMADLGMGGSGTTLPAAATDLREGVLSEIYTACEPVLEDAPSDELDDVYADMKSDGYTPTGIYVSQGHEYVTETDGDGVSLYGLPLSELTKHSLGDNTALLVDVDRAGFEIAFSNESVETEDGVFVTPRPSHEFTGQRVRFRWDCNWQITDEDAVRLASVPEDTYSERLIPR